MSLEGIDSSSTVPTSETKENDDEMEAGSTKVKVEATSTTGPMAMEDDAGLTDVKVESTSTTDSAGPTEDEVRAKMIKFMNDDHHMAKVKHEYLNVHYKARLVTKYLPESVKTELEEKQGQDAAQENGEPPKKKVKLTGRNKKRPRQKFTDPSQKICSYIAAGQECTFGEKCRFPHDLQKFVKNKPPDISENCYNFEQFGKCPQGITCRYASKHLTEDFRNIIDEEKFASVKPQASNFLTKDLQFQLRKRTIAFPKSDKYLASIGIKPKHKYRTPETKFWKTLTSGGKDEKQSDQNTVPSSDDRENQSKQKLTSEPPSDKTENQTAPSGGEDKNQSGASNSVEVKAESDLKILNEENRKSRNCDAETGETMECDSVEQGEGQDGAASKLSGCVTDEDIIKIRPGEKKTIDFSDKLYLAPLTTVGNLPFRRICKQYGADVTCGEMALATNLLQGQMSEWALLRRHASEDLFGVQLCGGHADTMTRCAELLSRTIDVDFIDVNVGCPIDLIFHKGEGSALMGRLTKFEQVVRGMSSILDIPLTVKIRMGIYESKPVAHTVVPKIRDWGAALVTLHGRSREQRYTKPADWSYISECAEAAKPMPLFGNGDILSYEEYQQRRETTGVAGAMIARGALIKPWIFNEIKEKKIWDISSTERFDMLKDFTNYGLEHWGSDTQGVETTRRFLLEWLSFLHRYIPVGILDQLPQRINHRPPRYIGRNDLETLMASENSGDWVKISEMLLGPVHDDFTFLPKHKANSYK